MREKVRGIKRELILQAALETFYEHGYRATTVDMIAEKLSGTKAIFYYQFNDKHEALTELFAKALQIGHEALDRAVSENGSPGDKLSAFARHYGAAVIDHQMLVGVFWREERNLEPEARAAVTRQQKRIDDKLSALLQLGVDTGDFRIADIRSTARAIIGMITFTYTWWRPQHRVSKDEMSAQFVTLALRMAGVAGA